MAKMTNCAFCGKEIKKAFFGGEDNLLDVGTFKQITCCDACYNKYKKEAKGNRKRFVLKLDTMKRTNKAKYSEEEIAKLFMTYIQEKNEQLAKHADVCDVESLAFFTYDIDGRFSVREYGKGFANQDVDGKQMAKSFLKADRTECHYFTKDDITRIEFAKNGMGDFDGLFHKIYSFAIRLNDESVMTYKPCITRTAAVGKGFGFGYQKSAEKQLVAQLEAFKRAIGSDLPIVKVKKI